MLLPPPLRACNAYIFSAFFAAKHTLLSNTLYLVYVCEIRRSVTLPLLMDSRGHVAPPTVWPVELALPATSAGISSLHAIRAIAAAVKSSGKAFWLPGWGTFLSPPQSGETNGMVTTKPAIGGSTKGLGFGANGPWPWLGVLTAMSAAAEDSTPFMRLGGSPNTDMSSLCHEVSRAGWRGGASGSSGSGSWSGSNNPSSNDIAGGGGSGGGAGGGKGGALWRGQQKALVEAALEEGLRMVHVPGLEGSASAGFGDGGGSSSGGGGGGSSGAGGSSGGGGGSGGAPWPGPAGYTFTCWMRFNPPASGDGAEGGVFGAGNSAANGGRVMNGGLGDGSGGGWTRPERMQAWGVDVGKTTAAAAAAAAAIAAAATAGTGGGGLAAGVGGGDRKKLRDRVPTENDLLEAATAKEEGFDVDGAEGISLEKVSPTRDRGATVDISSVNAGMEGLKLEKRGSVESTSGRGAGEGDVDDPRPHMAGRQV